MHEEATPSQNYIRAKKNKHSYNISAEAFSLDGRQFILSNISLKKDYSDLYDFINYRRGLTYIEQIIDFKHTELVVARKGLRKFKDLMAQYLDIKESHVNSSKYHSGQKHRLFKNLQDQKFTSFVIYNTQKVNGENAQISFVCDKYWLIGSKNKCLLAMGQQDLQKLKNKHQYKQTSLIARTWFNIIKNKSEDQINFIKKQLSSKTLIGQYCNMDNMQHLVNYGQEPQLFFYALVDKNDLTEDCLPLSITYKFLETSKLPKVKVQVRQTKTYDHTIEQLRKIVVKMNETTMKEGGQGSVLYISGVEQHGQHNLLICKVKTIEYKIFRKLRQKLKIYLQKFNKNFDNLLKKFTKQISEIARQFNLNRPLNEYIQLARRAFVLCQDQNRPISKFISNRFIDFLHLLQKNISKERFKEIVNGSIQANEIQSQQEEKVKQQSNQNEYQQKEEMIKEQSEQQRFKKVLVLIPITIPSSGKTSLLSIVRDMNPNFRLWSISSDECRKQIMDQLMRKSKTMSKKQAFQKSADRANKLFYSKMGEVFKNISMSKQVNHVFFIDKNHPQSAIKPSIKNIQQKITPFNNIKVLKICVLPACQKRFAEKGLYNYPFSAAYILSCLKRVLSRPQHLTLQGTEQQRFNIVVCFTNLFRNFSSSPYNLGKYFNQKIYFELNNQKCLIQERDQQLLDLFKIVILSGQPGKFDQIHPKLQLLIQMVKKWELVQSLREDSAKQVLLKLQEYFMNFDSVTFQKQEKKQ